ncbi:hypothetical protein [Nocardia bovistercoris]|uniref:Uncharacterized protein n=1 Tax=Nocardia bovistercoris TaxID=2785916 RepID=A0A931N2J0_9NOCA|nr:hypothetical protein [Nocardia bovistercoris]MBH0776959.1 hypothetical protein [Nocardia bovistercoris]
MWTKDCALCSGASDDLHAPTTWTNLLLCCDGNERAGSVFTCDKSKEATDICAVFRNPKNWRNEQVLEVDRGGRAIPSSGLPIHATTVVETILNLNAEHLVAARKAVIAAQLREIARVKAKHHGLSSSRKAKIAAVLCVQAESAEFASVLLMVADRLRE